MQSPKDRVYVPLKRGRVKEGPLGFPLAVVLLFFGNLFGRLSQFCVNLSRLWAGDRTCMMVERATRLFGSHHPRHTSATPWEHSVVRFLGPIIMAVSTTLVVLWGLLLVGGVLVWLVLNGFGLLLMLGATIVGSIIGLKRARLNRHLPQQERLN